MTMFLLPISMGVGDGKSVFLHAMELSGWAKHKHALLT